jgi:putative DNA primase/helicase
MMPPDPGIKPGGDLPRPQALPVIPDGIPAELRARSQWVLWRYELRKGKWTKPPFDVRTGGRADSTDPKTWASFEDVWAAYQKGGWDGIGFVHLPEDNLTGTDVDHCRDPQSGGLTEQADAIKSELSTYAEASPSATGIRAYAYGKKPGRKCKKGSVEMYDGLTAEGEPGGRFLTLTGHRLPGSPATIERRPAEIDAIYWRELEPAKRPPDPGRNGASSNGTGGLHLTAKWSPPDRPLTDDEIIKVAETRLDDKLGRLWAGDTAGYPSPSEADAALCCKLFWWMGGPDKGRCDRLIRQSKLMRAKWDERHGAETYGERTLRYAAEKQMEFRRPETADGSLRRFAEGQGGDDKDPPHLTDKGNAIRVVRAHGADLHYCWLWKKWLCWDGRRWAEDVTGEAVRRVKRTQADLYAWAAAKIRELGELDDDDARKAQLAPLTKLLGHCLKWEDARSINRCLELARSEPGIPVMPAELDADPFLFNCLNGTIDLRTGELRPHRREDLITKLAPVAYDPAARCPLWEATVSAVLDDNPDLVGYLQRRYGHALTGDTSEQSLAILHGTGQNGKTTIINTALEVLGPDYAIKASRDLFMAKKQDSHPTQLAQLFGKRFVACVETAEGRRLDEELVKELTGSDVITARRMREDYWSFRPTHKCFLATNHRPEIRGTDEGIWRRQRLIPFTVRFWDPDKGEEGPPCRRVDKQLPDKLKAEHPGILRWMVEGCLAWQRHGMQTPEEVLAATNNYRADQDVLGRFLADCCVTSNDDSYRVRAGQLYAAYKGWFEQNEEGSPLSSRRFGEAMTERGFGRQTSNGTWYLRVRLREATWDED